MIKERHCTGCDTTKLIEEFVKDKHDKSGYTYRCKVCRAKQCKAWADANSDKVKKSRLKNKDKQKAYYQSDHGKKVSRKAHLKRTYGVDYETFEKLNSDQDGKCAICKGSETCLKNGVLSLDHNHKTGKIRGLLCSNCNTSLGFAKENIKILENMINIINQYEYESNASL